MNITVLKDIAQTIQSIVTATAIITGGFWSYKLFIQKRERYPRVEIKHQVTHKVLQENRSLLCLDIYIRNIGGVLLTLDSGTIFVKQVLPLPTGFLDKFLENDEPVEDQPIEWKLVAFKREDWESNKLEIEPGESELLHYEFIISSNISTIIVYSHFPYTEKHKLAWNNRKKRGLMVSRFFSLVRKLKRRTSLGWNLTTIHDLIS